MFKSSKKQNKTKQKKKQTRNVSFIFNVNNKDTRMTAASIVNFEHILHFILLILLLTLNKCWLCLWIYIFSNSEKYIVLWAGKICWSTCFNLCSLKIRLPKDYISWQHLKKISRTLKYSINFVKQKTKQGNSISMKNLKPKGIPQQI